MLLGRIGRRSPLCLSHSGDQPLQQPVRGRRRSSVELSLEPSASRASSVPFGSVPIPPGRVVRCFFRHAGGISSCRASRELGNKFHGYYPAVEWLPRRLSLPLAPGCATPGTSSTPSTPSCAGWGRATTRPPPTSALPWRPTCSTGRCEHGTLGSRGIPPARPRDLWSPWGNNPHGNPAHK
jgi:hypothetical protein